MIPLLPMLRIIPILLIAAVCAFPCPAVEFTLDPSGSALWGGGQAITLSGEWLVTGHPDGLRVWQKTVGGQRRLTGQLEIRGGVRDLASNGTVVYGLDGAGNAFMASIADPSQPSNEGELGPVHEWSALAINGHFALLAGTDSAMSFDITDPFDPVVAGIARYSGAALSVAAHDTLFAIGQGSAGLLVGRQHPDGSLSIQGHLTGQAVSELVTDGTYGWAPQGDSGVLILDFTNPNLPVSVARIYTYGVATHLSLAGDRLLVADEIAGLSSYRLIARPFPYWQSELNSLHGVDGLMAESPSRFYAIRDGEVFTVDVDVAGRLSQTAQFSHVGAYRTVLRYREWIYVMSTTGIWRADGAMPLADSNFIRFSSQSIRSAVVVGDKLLTAEGHSGARLYRIKNDGSLEFLSRIPALTSTGGVVFSRDSLMVLDSVYGFQIYGVTNPYAPAYLGGRALDRQAPVAAIYRNYLYISEPLQGVSIWNWQYTAKPEKLGFLPHTRRTEGILIDGNRLYVADRDSGLTIFDLTVPTNPATLARIPAPFSPTSLCRSGRLLYTGQSDCTVSEIDVLNPASPVLLAVTEIPGPVHGVSQFGERTWVSTESAVRTLAVGPALLPGDFNADGFVDIFDVTSMIAYCFSAGDPPFRLNAADVNADGQTDLIDIVLLIDYIFSGGPDLLPGKVE